MKPIVLPEHKRYAAKPKWCTHCGRWHSRSLACELELTERTAKSGNIVLRWCRPAEKSKKSKGAICSSD